MIERKPVFKPSAGPSMEEYTKPELPQLALLDTTIENSSYLKELALHNKIDALTFAFYRKCVEKAVPDCKSLVAYYPGIGGGNEPLDPISAFYTLGVDEVIGVDIERCRRSDWDPNCHRVDLALEKITDQPKSNIKILSASENFGEFIFDDKKRKISYYKGDAFKYMPQEDFQVIYQRREASLIPYLPRNIIEKARLIFCEDDNTFMPQRVADFALTHGFKVIDLGSVNRFLNKSSDKFLESWDGNPQLAIR